MHLTRSRSHPILSIAIKLRCGQQRGRRAKQTISFMRPEEKDTLRTAVQTICDPRGNWEYGWKLICLVSEVDPELHPAPFRKRSDEELQHLADPERLLRLGHTEANPSDDAKAHEPHKSGAGVRQPEGAGETIA